MRLVMMVLLMAGLVFVVPDTQGARRRRPAAAARVARGRIVGRVLNTAGKPAAHARLHVHRRLRRGVHPALRTGGTFATGGLPTGLFLVDVRNAHGHGRATALVTAGKTTSVLVHLHGRRTRSAHARHALGTRLRHASKQTIAGAAGK